MTSKGESIPVLIDDQWRFVGGRWEQDQEGLIFPPVNLADENLAFYAAHAFGDFEAEFEFCWKTLVTTAAFVFRAQDACHYYVLDFPSVRQQCRAEHFWATISKVDERGYREGLRATGASWMVSPSRAARISFVPPTFWKVTAARRVSTTRTTTRTITSQETGFYEGDRLSQPKLIAGSMLISAEASFLTRRVFQERRSQQ